MNMPNKGTLVTVEGYGSAIFAGAYDLDEPDDAGVLLKFEGRWHGNDLHKGYGRGIIEVPLDEFKENRVHREQLSDPASVDVSTHKRDAVFEERFEA